VSSKLAPHADTHFIIDKASYTWLQEDELVRLAENIPEGYYDYTWDTEQPLGIHLVPNVPDLNENGALDTPRGVILDHPPEEGRIPGFPAAITKGMMIDSVNGVSMTTSSFVDFEDTLHTVGFPLTLRFHKHEFEYHTWRMGPVDHLCVAPHAKDQDDLDAPVGVVLLDTEEDFPETILPGMPSGSRIEAYMSIYGNNHYLRSSQVC